MELRHLRYFLAVADTGSISRAAQKLFIAQPPLSQQIRALEGELGVRLFDRHPRGVRPTEAGRALLPEARVLIERSARLRDHLHGAVSVSAPVVRLGVVPSAQCTVVPRLTAALAARGDGTAIAPVEAISDDQIDGLLAGRLDAAVLRGTVRHPRLALGPVLSDPFVLAAPPAGPGSRGRTAPRQATMAAAHRLRDWADADFVAFTRHHGPAYFDRMIHACARAGFSPRIRHEASTVHGVLGLVEAGLGVALVPASVALLPAPRVRLLALERTAGGEVLAFATRRTAPSTPVRAVRDATATVFDAMAAALATVGRRNASAPVRRKAPG